MDYEIKCAGCGGTIVTGEKIWVSDIGEEKVITHPLAECLRKYVQPEEAKFISETTITNKQDEPQRLGTHPIETNTVDAEKFSKALLAALNQDSL